MLTLAQANKTWIESKLYFECTCGETDHISKLLTISLSPNLLCPNCKMNVSRNKLSTLEEHPKIIQTTKNESTKKQTNKNNINNKKQLNFDWIKKTFKKN